jgi:ERF superfamily
MDGMIQTTEGPKPGKILELWKKLRVSVGVIQAKQKPGMRFKTRSSEDLIDAVRQKANSLGILIYPRESNGVGFVVEDGTLASVNLTIIAQAVEDGSSIQIAGFGLGADSQDKAGGKAGTYAFKAALIQALLAGGTENAKSLGVVDTDDSDAPIEGGVKPKTRAKAITVDDATVLFASVRTKEEYDAALKQATAMQPANQLLIRDAIKAAKARISEEPKVSER